jgi:transcriptional regulator with XRE-family HTH domain
MPNINSRLLALKRKHHGYEQKQIAVLLGHKSTYQISRYETGQREPGLKDELKLFMLYGLPVRALFDQYLRKCRKELENTIRNSKMSDRINLENVATVDYCSYLEAMSACLISTGVSDAVRHHIKILIDQRMEKSIDG